MTICASVVTFGDEFSFSFCGAVTCDCEFCGYHSIEEIVPEHVISCISESLWDNYYEAMNGNDPWEDIEELLKKDSRYQSLSSMSYQVRYDFVRAFLEEINISTDITFYLDSENHEYVDDITYLFQKNESVWKSFVNEWHEEICDTIASTGS